MNMYENLPYNATSLFTLYPRSRPIWAPGLNSFLISLVNGKIAPPYGAIEKCGNPFFTVGCFVVVLPGAGVCCADASDTKNTNASNNAASLSVFILILLFF